MKKWSVGILICFLTLGMLSEYSVIVSDAQPKVEEERDTLENQTLFTGSAEAETVIACSVYTVDNEQKTTLLYQTSEVVGASGLYQLTIPLPVLGRQYVLLRVGDEESTYAYNRYRKQLSTELEEYYLNVYQVLSEMK